MFQDLRQSIRAITRAKGTAAVLLLSLALGTGVNAAVYGVLDALLLRGPAGVEDPSRLVSVYTSALSGTSYGPSSYPDFLSIRTRAKSLAASAAIDDNIVENVLLGELGQSVRIAAVSDDYFAVLQMRAHAGRLLAPADAGADPAAVVVSDRLSEQLGGADEILEKTLTIADREYVIVGVAPPRFRGLQIGRECDAWILMGNPSAARGDRRLAIVARLAPDATLEEANEDLRRLSDDLASRFPETNRGSVGQADAPRRIIAVPYSALDPATKRHTFLIGLIVGGASTLLLASACLNVGSLLLSKTVTRRHEIAIKMTLGATRSRLVRQLLTESCCLSIAGAGVGLLFAIWTMGAIPALFIAEHAERLDTRLDAPVMLLTVGVAFLAGALFGLVPALQSTASPPVTALRGDSGGVSGPQNGARLRALVVGAQVTLSTVLLLATGLLVKSLTQALEGDAGPAVRNVAFVTIQLPGQFVDPVRGVSHRDALLDRLEDLDGVEAVGWAATLPLGKGNRRRFRINGDGNEVSDTVELETNIVSPGYFHALALSRVEGRLFDERDGALAPPVVVVDELLARRYFGPSAAGRHLVDAQGTRAEIIGVVRSGRYRTLQQPPQPRVYYPPAQEYLYRGHLVVRTAGDPEPRLPTILSAIESTGEDRTILRASTLETHLSESRALDRLTTTLVGLCGLIALAMATIGVYGIMTDAVQRRTREIGLRVALGARRGHVARLVFTEAVYLALAGLLTGSVLAVGITQVARFAIGTTASLDIVTLAAASSALAAVIAVAAILPLRRALRVSPNIALRAE